MYCSPRKINYFLNKSWLKAHDTTGRIIVKKKITTYLVTSNEDVLNSSIWKHTTCATRVLFPPLFSRNFDDQWVRVFTGLLHVCYAYVEIHLPNVSSAFKQIVTKHDNIFRRSILDFNIKLILTYFFPKMKNLWPVDKISAPYPHYYG